MLFKDGDRAPRTHYGVLFGGLAQSSPNMMFLFLEGAGVALLRSVEVHLAFTS